jgi:hypothetical protein
MTKPFVKSGRGDGWKLFRNMKIKMRDSRVWGAMLQISGWIPLKPIIFSYVEALGWYDGEV